jgi:hypothetical protein
VATGGEAGGPGPARARAAPRSGRRPPASRPGATSASSHHAPSPSQRSTWS